MHIPRRRLLHLAAGAAALQALPRSASAQAYPSKPITMIVPFGPGSGSDTISRVVAQHLGAALKQSAEIDMLHVPYKTVPVALNDVLAGRVSMMFADLTTGLPHVKAARCVH